MSGPLHVALRRLDPGRQVVEEFGRQVAAESDFVSPICLGGFRHWLSLGTDAGLPPQGSLVPDGMVALLPYVYLVDVLRDQRGRIDFRYRLVGTDIVSHTERDNTGRVLSEIAGQGSQRVLAELCTLAETFAAPFVQRIGYRSKVSSNPCWYETTVMPMTDGGREITRLFGVAEHFYRPVGSRPSPQR